jgi:hypothetical protein
MNENEKPWWYWPVCCFTVAIWLLTLLDGSVNMITFLFGR